MKILCVADHIDPLVYSSSVKSRFGDVDLVLSAGDLPMDYIGFIASSLNKPVGFVFGNHNLKELPTFSRSARPLLDSTSIHSQIRNQFGATYLEDRVRRINGLLIAGLGGSMRYNNGEHQFTEGQMYRRMWRLVPTPALEPRRPRTLSRYPPDTRVARGIHDRQDPCHVGFRSMLWFMRRFRPRYLLHGHIHLYDLNAQRVTQFRQTQVINVYDHYVLDVEETDE